MQWEFIQTSGNFNREQVQYLCMNFNNRSLRVPLGEFVKLYLVDSILSKIFVLTHPTAKEGVLDSHFITLSPSLNLLAIPSGFPSNQDQIYPSLPFSGTSLYTGKSPLGGDRIGAISYLLRDYQVPLTITHLLSRSTQRMLHSNHSLYFIWKIPNSTLFSWFCL